ncbi:hypothetical protein [Corynebacterium glyciniphilum]|uniref:hypothetical protein n=1 Tax=Corynebacterium glyciniphilum TaxID=1404244 RepID=UPI0011AB8229|nr:hypothetical protein [Corynebacterium glyciniphilum]
MPDHGITPDHVANVTKQTATEEQIDRAVASVRSLCGWHVWPVRTETLRLDTAGDTLLTLPTLHVEDITAVRINGTPTTAYTWSTDGLLQLPRHRAGLGALEVDIKHGFDRPADLIGVVVQMIGRAARPAEQMSVGGISVGAAQGVTPQSSEWRVLGAYELGAEP